MALKKEQLAKIAELLKIKAEDLTKAITDQAEVELTLDEKLTTYTEAEINTLTQNKYNEGKKAGVEMDVKTAKEKYGLDFQGKTIDGLLDSYQKKVLADAKIEPEQKIKELNDKLANLQNTVKTQEQQLAEKDAEVEKVRTTGELYKFIPEFGDTGPALGRDEVIKLMEANGYSFKIDNGQSVASKGGTQILDKTSSPVPVKDVITGFLKEKKLIVDEKIPGGRGGKDTPPGGGKALSISDVKAQFEAQGKSVMGQEFADAVAAASKDNPDFKLE